MHETSSVNLSRDCGDVPFPPRPAGYFILVSGDGPRDRVCRCVGSHASICNSPIWGCLGAACLPIICRATHLQQCGVAQTSKVDARHLWAAKSAGSDSRHDSARRLSGSLPGMDDGISDGCIEVDGYDRLLFAGAWKGPEWNITTMCSGVANVGTQPLNHRLTME